MPRKKLLGERLRELAQKRSNKLDDYAETKEKKKLEKQVTQIVQSVIKAARKHAARGDLQFYCEFLKINSGPATP